MKSISKLLGILGLAALVPLAQAYDSSKGDFLLQADQLQWEASAKTQRQLVHEDSAYRVKTVRLRIPPNTDLPPHGVKNGYFIATVISGTLQVGFGKTFEDGGLKTLPPGGVFSHPDSQEHYARTGAEPVVLQVTIIEGEKPEQRHAH
ncbi:cupin domain-containing protein [Paracandidimonas soli]|uniref:Quercetin dioxygenase-like cupin family protein n=1 Tax=Paracandidimonas soli TaxID=1917182 RepID=A0A4R3VGJ4_9BURK|nr:cupin domain-containing protein [Paracandidimonas soli]TCV02858.1 hypothetical protein EV686_101316 [Paracandidimonas soli]